MPSKFVSPFLLCNKTNFIWNLLIFVTFMALIYFLNLVKVISAKILQVQAVLLLLGGREVPPTMPTIPMNPHQTNRVSKLTK